MKPLVIFGAGSIGCYIGGRLAASGTAVHLIGRPALGETLDEHGIQTSDHLGGRWHARRDQFRYASDVSDDFPATDVVLVCVKSAATAEAGAALADVLAPGTLVISFQNGLHNAEVLAQALPHCEVLTGMVPFNVVNQGQGHFHQGSQGQLEVQQATAIAPIGAAFDAAGLTLQQHPDMAAVLWSKLILNLNNPINALAGIPLKTELSQRSYRRALALAQIETLRLLEQANIATAKIIALPTPWLPHALSVPDWLFRILGGKMLAIDPQARSSMWEDLERGRRTEIDWINGEVVRLAESLGRQAPVNRMLIQLIREAEQGGRRDWSGDELLAVLRRAATAAP